MYEKGLKPSITIPTYWQDTSIHQNEYNELSRLANNEGPASTLQGELFTAGYGLYYHYHNLGLFHNTSGYINFIIKYNDLLQIDQDILNTIKSQSNTGDFTNLDLTYVLEEMMNKIVEFYINSTIIDNSDSVSNYFEPDPEPVDEPRYRWEAW